MAGVETHIRSMLPELIRLRPDARFSLFLSPPGAEALAREPWASEIELVTHSLVGIPRLSAIAEATLLGRLAARRGIDVLDSLSLTGPLRPRFAHVVTIPDVTWHHEPGSLSRTTTMTWRALVPLVARRADRVITGAEWAKRDIVNVLRLRPERVDVVPLGPGVDAVASPVPEAELRARYELGSGPVVLTVSGKRPPKNLARLLEAMRLVVEDRPDAVLVLPGAPTPHEDELKALARRLGIAGAVRFLGYVSAEELEGLYRAAALFVFPSLREGFGLPLLEAMRRGVPVASSRAASLPEVAGDAALYFDPHDSADMARAIGRVLADRALARRLTDAGLARQQRFSWRRNAEETLACLERAWRQRYRAPP